jgi:hypothetical protein
VIREVERLGIKRKTYWELQSPDDPNLKIILRVDTMKKFANKKIWSVKRHSKPLTW